MRTHLLSFACLTCIACGASKEGDHVVFTIPRGAPIATIAETLAVRGVVSDPRFFRFYTAMSGRSREIKAGTFELPQGIGMRTALDALIRGIPALRALVVPEGLMLTEIAATVERQLGIPSEEFLSAASDSAWLDSLHVPRSTLEGYLFPSTHMVRLDASAKEVVDQMLTAFLAQWDSAWTPRLDSLNMSRHEVVTLASIIEGEVRHDEDRRFVASVYHNRLARGMRLQADPTVVYALGHRRRLFERDYQHPSPYNTYLIDGLPPGPIGSPSTASLYAALYPAATDFLYFVARDDGRHVFSRTYAEHRRTIRQIRDGS